MPRGKPLIVSDVSDALRDSNGYISIAAEKLGVYRPNLSYFIHQHPELEKVLEECLDNRIDTRNDKAENNFDRYLNNLEKYPKLCYQATINQLNTFGKNRKWGQEKQNDQKSTQEIKDGWSISTS